MKLLVLLNQTAGTLEKSETGDEPARIERGFRDAGVDVEVRTLDGSAIEQAARDALRSDIDGIIAGGGDGTLNTIANVLCGSGKAYGVLPLGTHNHFAKDLGIPLDLEQAVAAIAAGEATELPVAEVNGRIFLNFSGLGFHPELVRHRDAQRRTLGRQKWSAMIVAMVRVFTRFPIIRVRLSAPEMTLRRITPSVIVCNNPHQMKVFGVESASVPQRGLLNVYVARRGSRMGMIWLFVRALFKSLDHGENFESIALREVTIDTAHRHARVSIDGEVTDMRPPLRYKVRESGLRVIVPRKEPA
jgi:diacylglycerol kinase family enzyme